MEIVYIIGGFLLGVIVTAFTVVQQIIVFRFGIPTAIRLTRIGVMKPRNPVARNYVISAIVLLGIFGGIYWLVSSFIPNLRLGFWIGAIFTLIIGISKTGNNSNNLVDFAEVNKKYFVKEKLEPKAKYSEEGKEFAEKLGDELVENLNRNAKKDYGS